MFSEYTEYEDEMVGEPVPDDSSTLVHHGLYDDDETRARRLAWRKHVSSTTVQLAINPPVDLVYTGIAQGAV